METNFIVKYYLKIFYKALATKLKSVLPALITTQQTAYVKNRYIGKAGRLISDILDISEKLEKLSIGGYLVTADIEKTFDSLDHEFLPVVFKKIAFVIILLTVSKYH